MASEVELERIVVRLIGDGSSFQKMMVDAVTSTRVMTNRLYTALMRVERFAGTLIKGLGSFGLASGLRAMFNQFADMEEGQIKLNAAIEANGHAISSVLPRYQAFAEAESKFSLDTKGSILNLLRKAEVMGHSGDVAMRVVKNAMDLADATDRDAESLLRVTSAMEAGNYALLRRLPGLQGAKNDTELLTKANALMAQGAAMDAAMFDSAHGKVIRLGRAFKSMGKDIGEMVAQVFLPVAGMLQQIFALFKDLEPAQKQQVVLITGMTIAWLGMGPVTQVMKDLLAPTYDLLKFLVISLPKVVAQTIAWVIWKTVLGLTAIAVFTLTGLLWLLTSGQVLFTIKTLIVSAAMAVWKGIIWLVNGALTVMNFLLAPATMLAIVVTVGLLGAAFFVVYSAVSSLVTVFKNLTGLSGPLGAVTGMLAEWWTMIKQIFNTASTDLPRAWEMLKAGFTLAVSQIKDLWGPLWRFITDGFGLVWEAVAELFKSKMIGAARGVANALRFVPGWGGVADRLPEALDENFIVNRMRRDLQGMSVGFRVVESDATIAARAAYNALVPLEGGAGRAANRLNQVANNMKKVREEAQRFDAALVGSVEALARVAEYRDRIAFERPTSTPTINAQAAIGGAGLATAAGGMGTPAVVQLLTGILGALQNKSVVNLQVAGLNNS